MNSAPTLKNHLDIKIIQIQSLKSGIPTNFDKISVKNYLKIYQ
jgi:hypothetical protein